MIEHKVSNAGTRMRQKGPGSIFILNNYQHSGIGDFGNDLVTTLRELAIVTDVIETTDDWRGFIRPLWKIIFAKGRLVLNIGLTAWGDSKIRNFLGFVWLGYVSFLRPATVILHNLIEVVDTKDAGYKVGKITVWGSRFVVKLLKRANFIVMSDRMQHELVSKYRIKPSACLVSPCWVIPNNEIAKAEPPRVCTVGYIAPYKGVETFLKCAETLRGRADFIMIGQPHRVLSSDARFKEWFVSIKELAKRAGVRMFGYLPKDDLMFELQRCCIGVLPYTSSSGASASFSTMASAGLPVVSSDLHEFRFVKSNGAGIVIVPGHTTNEFAKFLESLIANPILLARLSSDQRTFASNNSWTKFANELLRICGENATGNP